MKIFEVAEIAQPIMDCRETVAEQAVEDFGDDSFMDSDDEEDEDMADMMNYILNGEMKKGGFVEKSNSALTDDDVVLPKIKLVRNPGMHELTINIGCHFG